MMYRRQRQQYVFAGVLGVIAVINLLFFILLHRPIRSEYDRLQNSIAALRTEVSTGQQAVSDLERTSGQLERFEQDRLQLFTLHFVNRDEGFAKILPQLDLMAQRAGVTKTVVRYAPEPVPQYRLESVKIDIPVQGGYSNVVSFIKELEDSDTLYLINSIDVRSVDTGPSGGPGGPGGPGGSTIELILGLETFFYR